VSSFRLGINYWPRSSAMYMWRRFDVGEIREDFARIAGWALDTVRFFIMWEEFAPAAGALDAQMYAQLEALMDALHANKLAGIPALFTGHMSGVNWLPSWTLDERTPAGRFRTISGGDSVPYGVGDFYSGELLEAQVRFASALGERLRGHPALHLWDLGNEFSNLRLPGSPSAAARWSARLTYALREASGTGVTGGLHSDDLTEDRHIRPSSIAAEWECASMHGYSVYAPFARDRRDPEVAPFLCQLTQSCAKKPVLFAEFGNPTCSAAPSASPTTFACLSEQEMSEYAKSALERLHRCGALGALWWCYADYAVQLAALPPFDEAPHELTFGVIRSNGSEKPVAGVLSRFAAQRRVVSPSPLAIVDETAYFDGLPASLSDAYEAYTRASG
jgi:endo-1,4-beta-mannosidase